MAVPPFQKKIHLDGIPFEIYAYRPLTKAEIDREIALFVISRQRFSPGHTYKIFSDLGKEDGPR